MADNTYEFEMQEIYDNLISQILRRVKDTTGKYVVGTVTLDIFSKPETDKMSFTVRIHDRFRDPNTKDVEILTGVFMKIIDTSTNHDPKGIVKYIYDRFHNCMDEFGFTMEGEYNRDHGIYMCAVNPSIAPLINRKPFGAKLIINGKAFESQENGMAPSDVEKMLQENKAEFKLMIMGAKSTATIPICAKKYLDIVIASLNNPAQANPNTHSRLTPTMTGAQPGATQPMNN